MSNEERIMAWKQRRAAEATVEGAGEDRGASAIASLLSEHPTQIDAVVNLFVGALGRSPRGSVAARRAVYRELEAAIERSIGSGEVHPNLAELLRRQIHAVVITLEADIRRGVDVLDPQYQSASLAARNAELLRGFQRREKLRRTSEARDARRDASRRDVAMESELDAGERGELRALSARLDDLRATGSTLPANVGARRTLAFFHLFPYAIHVIGSESRIALLWAMVGPAVLLSLISSMYFLMGLHFILGMDVPTFSLTGATTWIMIRQIIFRTSTSYVSHRGLINLDAITPCNLALVQSCIYLVIYLFVYVVLISAGHAVGIVSLPANWITCLVFVLLMALGASSIGLLFGSVASRWPYFLRFAAVIERFLELFSGVFFVSEQLPERFRPYFLWSPFAHGMQLLRSNYFTSYKSHDASLTYFMSSIVFMMAIALIFERRSRSRVVPM